MSTQSWNIVFLAASIAYVIIHGIYEDRTKRNEKLVTRTNWRERALLILVFVGSLFLPVLYVLTPWIAFADYQLPDVFPWCGAVVMVAALWLFWRSHVDLGLNWSRTLELRKGHRLVRQGVYRTIRHPMYAAIWLFGLGQGLLLQNWLAGWSGFAAFGVMYIVRVPHEEEMMCEFFGEEYRDYMRRTGRLFPRVNGDQSTPPNPRR